MIQWGASVFETYQTFVNLPISHESTLYQVIISTCWGPDDTFVLGVCEDPSLRQKTGFAGHGWNLTGKWRCGATWIVICY